jgi:hypothetical protein
MREVKSPGRNIRVNERYYHIGRPKSWKTTGCFGQTRSSRNVHFVACGGLRSSAVEQIEQIEGTR